jgi:hypothetical protein
VRGLGPGAGMDPGVGPGSRRGGLNPGGGDSTYIWLNLGALKERLSKIWGGGQGHQSCLAAVGSNALHCQLYTFEETC